MEDLFADIDLSNVSTSMTINGPAPIVMAMYIAVAEKTGVERSALSGTIQNDILKEYQAQKEYIFPPRPSVRLITDLMSRSEEHTSELQSLMRISYAVFCLKKKKTESRRTNRDS